ncbi:hypothetical protein BS17DRAFT_775772 [Gyrodon lividus]|nr:hypothetical protein BS17DRAFT_775772 [Gyrodon lividus]
MAQHGEEYLAVLRASYDYEPQSGDEIAIKENQIVFLLEKTDDDWWKVKIKGDSQDEDSPSGLVPAAYVEQAEHTSTVKALYDYDAAAPGELSIREDEILVIFDREDDWILVQSQKVGGKAGFVPGNYVRESIGEEEPELAPAPAPAPASTPGPRPQIVVPPSPEPPARPVSVYVDPADRVALAPVKAQADDIKTWAVSEVDKKGKKKKGTLGIGNGSLFFASESDKTPVQKWHTADVEDFTIEKQKHVIIDMGGINPMKLHFSVVKEEIAEAVLTKLDDSRKLAISGAKVASAGLGGRRSALTPPPRHAEAGSPSKRSGASVRFAEESPQIIPLREPSEDGEAEGAEENGVDTGETGDDEEEGEPVVALYDFEGTSSDELSVREGERLHIIEKEGEEWWKCRNAHGVEGVVPASYLESSGAPSRTTELEEDDSAARVEEERQEAERKERERQARERIEKERKKAEQERAKAAAETERKRQEKEEAAAAAQRKQRQEATKRAQQNSARPHSSQSKLPRDSSSSTRTSSEQKNGPPADSTRVWHDRSGQFRVEAALLGYTDGKLRLHKTNGVVIEVPSEKMSLEDMRYVAERLMKKKSSSSAAPSPAVRRASNDDDDRPLALKRQSDAARHTTAPPQKKKGPEKKKKGPEIDWFEFFLSAGCDVDDCTRYAHSFEKDKIDESLLPDITESTMRSLGLREGDIIRIHKAVQQKYAKPKALLRGHLGSDEELAMRLQEEENAKKPVSPAPNLFAGPGGVLKNNTQRRGRPHPSKSLPPPAVDLSTIGSASGQIKRSGSPLVRTSSPATASPVVQPPQRSSSAMATVSGFDDDAWTNRMGSNPPVPAPVPTPPAATAPMAPSAPPAPQAAIASALPPAALVQPSEGMTMGTSSLAKTTEADVFDQLARLSQLKTFRAIPSPVPTSAAPTTSPPVVVSPPPGYNSGLGMGSSSAPLAHHLQNQQSGAFPHPQQNGPRGPYAPVPANHSLLQPLIPTQTGFNSFVPTRPSNVSPFQPQPQAVQPSFLQSQPTGFLSNSQPLISQPTGFPTSGPLLTQPTGVPGGSLGNFTLTSFPSTALAPVQTNPTGFSSFGQSPFNNIVSTPSPVPSPAFSQTSNNGASSNTSPANVFAQMKFGTFASGNEQSEPQQAEKYDALRVNPQPTGWAPQATGWGLQNPNTGFQSGYAGF